MLGLEVSPVVQYVIAFAIVAALLALFAVVLRRIGGKRFAMPGQDRGRGRQPRLGIVDVYDLDRQRQLVLLRRDNVEHLVMLGGPNDLVVESNIVRVSAGRAPVTEMQNDRPGQAEPGQEQGRVLPELASAAVAAPVLAPVQPPGGRFTANGNAARENDLPIREPAIQQRQQQKTAPPAQAQAPRQEPRVERQAAAGPPAAAPPAVPPSRTPAPAPQPAAAESPIADLEALIREKPKPVEPAVTAPPAPPAEPKRGLFGFGRAAGAPPPSPAFPPRPRATPVAPDFAPQRAPSKFAPSDTPPAARVEPAGTGAAVEAQPKPARPLDDAILADMAKQLETALARPRSSAAASPVALKPAAPTAQPPGEPIDEPSEPKSYKPVTTAAAATVAAVASMFRSSSTAVPTGESNPVPPRPYGGEQPAQNAVDPIDGSRTVESRIDHAQPDESEKPAIGGGSFKPEDIATEVKDADATVAFVNTGDEEREFAAEAGEVADLNAIATPNLRDESEEALQPLGDETRNDADAPDNTFPQATATIPESTAGEQGPEELDPHPDLPEEDVPEEDEGELTERDLPEENLPEENLDASPEESQPESAVSFPPPAEAEGADGESSDIDAEEERKKPAPAVIDPFSVDEIEAEFARLLGRSVDKDPKSP